MWCNHLADTIVKRLVYICCLFSRNMNPKCCILRVKTCCRFWAHASNTRQPISHILAKWELPNPSSHHIPPKAKSCWNWPTINYDRDLDRNRRIMFYDDNCNTCNVHLVKTTAAVVRSIKFLPIIDRTYEIAIQLSTWLRQWHALHARAKAQCSHGTPKYRSKNSNRHTITCGSLMNCKRSLRSEMFRNNTISIGLCSGPDSSVNSEGLVNMEKSMLCGLKPCDAIRAGPVTNCCRHASHIRDFVIILSCIQEHWHLVKFT